MYRENWSDAGRPDRRPITIKGPEAGKDRSGRYVATLYGTGRVISVNHIYYTLDGFTIDGQEELADTPFPTDLASIDRFKNGVQSKVSDGRLIYVGAADDSRDITGITITNMFLNGGGGECVRLRNNAFGNIVADSVTLLGMFGTGAITTRRARYHNGEGVYIGTSRTRKAADARGDGSSNNVITATHPDVRLGVLPSREPHDTFLRNVCTATQVLRHAAATSSCGVRNVVRNKRVSDALHAEDPTTTRITTRAATSSNKAAVRSAAALMTRRRRPGPMAARVATLGHGHGDFAGAHRPC